MAILIKVMAGAIFIKVFMRCCTYCVVEAEPWRLCCGDVAEAGPRSRVVVAEAEEGRRATALQRWPLLESGDGAIEMGRWRQGGEGRGRGAAAEPWRQICGAAEVGQRR